MYREKIEKLLRGYSGNPLPHDPAHVEAYMLKQHPVLESLSHNEFAQSVGWAVFAIDEYGVVAADCLAKSYGLRPKKRSS